jgi:hypothetical protein
MLRSARAYDHDGNGSKLPSSFMTVILTAVAY